MHTLIRVVLAVTFITSSLGLTSAQAEDALKYSTVEPWTIAVDPSMGNGCFVVAEFQGGGVFRLGFDMTGDSVNVYVLFGNAKWRSIEFGKKYPVAMRFGNEPAWDGIATGFSFEPPENQPWLSLEIAEDQGHEFALEFMKELFVSVHYNTKEILRLSLKNSYQAGLQLVKCQESAIQGEEDPFEATSSNDNPDPFQ